MIEIHNHSIQKDHPIALGRSSYYERIWKSNVLIFSQAISSKIGSKISESMEEERKGLETPQEGLVVISKRELREKE